MYNRSEGHDQKINTGVQPKTFQGMGSFMESEDFNKHFVENKNKKHSRETFGVISPTYS